MALNNKTLFFGKFFSPAPDSVSLLDGYVSVDSGKIVSKGTYEDYKTYKETIDVSEYNMVYTTDYQFMIPGFVDCHVHAPQFPNLGVGLDRPLLEWLEKYTFPLEKKYADATFAARVYDTVVRRLLKNGTTTACYFGSLHLKGTLQLVDSVATHGQRALVGKVSMNTLNDANYFNSTEQEVEDAETFLKTVTKLKNDLVEPIITPRFALSCDGPLMKRLSALAGKYNCRIQSHISENVGEVQCTLDVFKDAKSYADVYDQHGLLTDKCIMAHAVHLSSDEMRTLGARGVSIAHCPASNTRLASGLCPLRQLLQHGLTVGLGTDVSGGDSASILDAIRRCMDVSVHRQLQGESGAAVSWKEALYMATLGGARGITKSCQSVLSHFLPNMHIPDIALSFSSTEPLFSFPTDYVVIPSWEEGTFHTPFSDPQHRSLRLDHKIGDFAVGKDFDALLVDVYKLGGPIDNYRCMTTEQSKGEYMESLLQRFVYLGDDRNIEKVFVQGKDVTQKNVCCAE